MLFKVSTVLPLMTNFIGQVLIQSLRSRVTGPLIKTRPAFYRWSRQLFQVTGRNDPAMTITSSG